MHFVHYKWHEFKTGGAHVGAQNGEDKSHNAILKKILDMMNNNFVFYETHLELFTTFVSEMSCFHTRNIGTHWKKNQ